MRANALWPTSDELSGKKWSEQVRQARSPEDRRRYALAIWNGISESGERFAPLLTSYLEPRGIKAAPTARTGMECWSGRHRPGS